MTEIAQVNQDFNHPDTLGHFCSLALKNDTFFAILEFFSFCYVRVHTASVILIFAPKTTEIAKVNQPTTILIICGCGFVTKIDAHDVKSRCG